MADGALAADGLIHWLAALATPLSEIAAAFPVFYRVIYPSMRCGYEAAGCPYGEGEEAMWGWWQEKAAVERARWLAEHERKWQELRATGQKAAPGAA